MATQEIKISIKRRRFLYWPAFWLIMAPAALLKWNWLGDIGINCMFDVKPGA
jgi:hypothetical protein